MATQSLNTNEVSLQIKPGSSHAWPWFQSQKLNTTAGHENLCVYRFQKEERGEKQKLKRIKTTRTTTTKTHIEIDVNDKTRVLNDQFTSTFITCR